MSRWKVDRRNLPYPRGMVMWAACCDGEKRLFPTWRMAMDYADRMARTRKVVLPRQPLPIRIGNRTIKQTSPHVVSIFRRSGSTAADIHRKHWKPLALALLALAEQENA